MMNWNVLPDLAAVALLTCVFASTVRRSHSKSAGLWLSGWLLVAAHFAASLFLHYPGTVGCVAEYIGTITLVTAGVLFQTAVVPYKDEPSRPWMTSLLMAVNTLYVILLIHGKPPAWALNATAALFGVGPLIITLASLKKFNSKLRWATVILNSSLAVFLLCFQLRPGNGDYLALYAVLFTVYLGCAINFLFAYRRPTTGSVITIIGFITWASVFLIGPWLFYSFPAVHVESEVWNLPKFIVAVGMILILLEGQIEYNKQLALHDPLTGLPNRRLFEDRLTSALDRARRTNTQMALLIIDLNRFKAVNDTLGHHVGDLLLERVGAIFAGRVRRSDTVARTGGDEFSIILEEPASRSEATSVAQALLELLHEPLQLESHTVRIGASIGVGIFPEDADEMEALCIVADKQMYEEKVRMRAQSRPESVPLAKPLPN
ncbi:MAG: GGDEF domain-containing protein [Terracidiphilus sp.]